MGFPSSLSLSLSLRDSSMQQPIFGTFPDHSWLLGAEPLRFQEQLRLLESNAAAVWIRIDFRYRPPGLIQLVLTVLVFRSPGAAGAPASSFV